MGKNPSVFSKTAHGSPFLENRGSTSRGPAHLALPLAAGAAEPAGLPEVFDSEDSLSLVVASVLSSSCLP
jgi:hypothetical protein